MVVSTFILLSLSFPLLSIESIGFRFVFRLFSAWETMVPGLAPMGGSPRPMEPMGPHRPRALKYTPTGPHRPRAMKYTPTGGSSRPIGQGPSAKAHRQRPMEPMGPHMGMYFWILYFWRDVDPLGESIRRLPGPLGGSDRTFVQQRLPPELPRVAQATQYPFIPSYSFINSFKNFNFLFYYF